MIYKDNVVMRGRRGGKTWMVHKRMESEMKLFAAAPQLLQAAWVALEYLSSTLNGAPDDPAIAAWNVLADAVASATSFDA